MKLRTQSALPGFIFISILAVLNIIAFDLQRVGAIQLLDPTTLTKYIDPLPNPLGNVPPMPLAGAFRSAEYQYSLVDVAQHETLVTPCMVASLLRTAEFRRQRLQRPNPPQKIKPSLNSPNCYFSTGPNVFPNIRERVNRTRTLVPK